ncbi:hypothetical protein CCP4SC76_390002 [Gammaproteobacteria bacterium]
MMSDTDIDELRHHILQHPFWRQSPHQTNSYINSLTDNSDYEVDYEMAYPAIMAIGRIFNPTDDGMRRAWQEVDNRWNGKLLFVDTMQAVIPILVFFVYSDLWRITKDDLREVIEAHRLIKQARAKIERLSKRLPYLSGSSDILIEYTVKNNPDNKKGLSFPEILAIFDSLLSNANATEIAVKMMAKIVTKTGNHSRRYFVIRCIAFYFFVTCGSSLYGTTARFASALLDEEISKEDVDNSLKNWAGARMLKG